MRFCLSEVIIINFVFKNKEELSTKKKIAEKLNSIVSYSLFEKEFKVDLAIRLISLEDDKLKKLVSQVPLEDGKDYFRDTL